MINGIYYQTIYLLILIFFSISCYSQYKQNYSIVDKPKAAFIYALFLALFIGLRPYLDVLTDTVGLSYYYNAHKGFDFIFSMDVENPLFDNFLLFMASKGLDFSWFLTIMSTIYFIGRYIALKKLFPSHVWAAYLLFLASFITYTSSVNGFKAGAAASFFCIAIAYRKKWVLTLLFLVLSITTHHSIIVCAVGFLITTFYKNTKIYMVGWLVALALALLHVKYFQVLFGGVAGDKGASYLLSENGAWMTGMRYDFVLYSAMPIILGWYLLFKKKIQIDETYQFILNLYIIVNTVWLLCMYANFTNRIAALSWFMYSIVLGYPFLSEGNIGQFIEKNRTFSIIFAIHLSFTAFMTFIYY